MNEQILQVLHKVQGVALVQRELMLALIESRSDRAALVTHAMACADQMRDMAVGSTQPEGTLEGIEAEMDFWRRRAERWSRA